jgi:SAM-dependent methyltransferase
MATELLFADDMTKMLESKLNGMPQNLRILEAGCGRSWPLQLARPFHLTGIDMDQAALSVRTDLNRAVVGDLRTAEFPDQSFDVIYSSYVLEHIRGAEQVLERFLRWLAPGGIVIFAVPDRDSAYGFATRMTPFWLHVWFYRHIVGLRQAGTPGFGPYPTCHDPVVSISGVRRFCEQRELPAPQIYRIRERNQERTVTAVTFLLSIVSLGTLSWRHNAFLCMLGK